MIRSSWALPLGMACREWLLALARVEADEGCPRLFAMKSDIAMYFADVTASWDAERRYHLMCERVKWLYTGNFGLPAIPVTADETAARAGWDYPWLGLKPTRHTPGKPTAEFTWVGGEEGDRGRREGGLPATLGARSKLPVRLGGADRVVPLAVKSVRLDLNAT